MIGLMDTPCTLWTGCLNDKGYACGWDAATKKVRRMHRVAWEQTYGDIPDGWDIDHKCFVRNCINPEHLEPVPHRENTRRRKGARKDNQTGIRGVTLSGSKFRVRLHVDDKEKYLGTFETLEEATQAAAEARLKYYGHTN